MWGARIRVRTTAGTRSERPGRRPTYDFQLEAFRDAVRGDAPAETDAAAGVKQMQALDAIYRAAGMHPRSGRTTGA